MSEPSTSEVLAGLVEEMRERSEAFDRGRPTARATYEDGIRAATWRQALALVEAALGRHGAGEVAAEERRSFRCPTCDSAFIELVPSPAGCPDEWHRPMPTTVPEWRAEVERWAGILAEFRFAPDPVAAARRLAADMRRELASPDHGTPTSSEEN